MALRVLDQISNRLHTIRGINTFVRAKTAGKDDIRRSVAATGLTTRKSKSHTTVTTKKINGGGNSSSSRLYHSLGGKRKKSKATLQTKLHRFAKPPKSCSYSKLSKKGDGKDAPVQIRLGGLTSVIDGLGKLSVKGEEPKRPVEYAIKCDGNLNAKTSKLKVPWLAYSDVVKYRPRKDLVVYPGRVSSADYMNVTKREFSSSSRLKRRLKPANKELTDEWYNGQTVRIDDVVSKAKRVAEQEVTEYEQEPALPCVNVEEPPKNVNVQSTRHYNTSALKMALPQPPEQRSRTAVRGCGESCTVTLARSRIEDLRPKIVVPSRSFASTTFDKVKAAGYVPPTYTPSEKVAVAPTSSPLESTTTFGKAKTFGYEPTTLETNPTFGKAKATGYEPPTYSTTTFGKTKMTGYEPPTYSPLEVTPTFGKSKISGYEPHTLETSPTVGKARASGYEPPTYSPLTFGKSRYEPPTYSPLETTPTFGKAKTSGYESPTFDKVKTAGYVPPMYAPPETTATLEKVKTAGYVAPKPMTTSVRNEAIADESPRKRIALAYKNEAMKVRVRASQRRHVARMKGCKAV